MELPFNSQIFIIDDDPFWTAMLSQMLEEIGYKNILTYDNGSEGLQNLNQNPRLIFLDYQMEGINGLEVLQKIKKSNVNIDVVFCTAHEDLSVALNAMQFGSLDYLLKENATKKEVAILINSIVSR
jgi:DNA-binding NtrC family response regulator